MSFRVVDEPFPITGFVRSVRCVDCGAMVRINVAHQEHTSIATALFDCMALEFERFIRAHVCEEASWVPMTARRVAEMVPGPIERANHCAIKSDSDDTDGHK